MSHESEPDRLMDRLRELPAPPLPGEVEARVYRTATREFEKYSRGPAWLLEAGRVWSEVGMPAMLVACAVGYLVVGWVNLVRVYGPEPADAASVATALPLPNRPSSHPNAGAAASSRTRAPSVVDTLPSIDSG